MGPHYCRPWNAGLASETPAVCRRLARLIEAIDTEINSNIVQGEILQDLRDFRNRLTDGLELEGWTFQYVGNKLKFRQPGHKRPFTREVPHAS